MAAKNTKIDVNLQVRLANGTTATGKVATKNLNFNNVKLAATDQQLYDAGTAVAGLVDKDLSAIRRIDTGDLTDEA